MHHSPPCRDPFWDDGTFAVMASLAPPEAASKDDIWGKCDSSWVAFQPWESPVLWWPFSIEYMFFCKYLFCSFPLQVELLNSTHYEQFFNRYNTRGKEHLGSKHLLKGLKTPNHSTFSGATWLSDFGWRLRWHCWWLKVFSQAAESLTLVYSKGWYINTSSIFLLLLSGCGTEGEEWVYLFLLGWG